MKIEKINDQQIRCTITGEDLARRHIRLSELAYGSEKTRELFQDMMEQASMDFGFDAEDIPIMIEAIPMSPEQIVIIVTKVDSPEELDARFSEFTHFGGTGTSVENGLREIHPDIPDELIDLLGRIRDEVIAARESAGEGGAEAKGDPVCAYVFADLEDAIPAAKAVDEAYIGKSSLYRDGAHGDYLLFMHGGKQDMEDFNRITHTVAAYLDRMRGVPATESYYKEHGRLVIADHAISLLASL